MTSVLRASGLWIISLISQGGEGTFLPPVLSLIPLWSPAHRLQPVYTCLQEPILSETKTVCLEGSVPACPCWDYLSPGSKLFSNLTSIPQG